MRILVLFLVVVSLFLVQCGSFHPMAQSQGPAGPQGPPGPIGPAGPVGPAGPQGATGPQGAMGLTGATGAPGTVGAQGPIGPAGPQGIAGQGFGFRGAYVPGNSYNAYDLATEGGSTYVALQANQNVEPATDVTNAGGHWAVEALAGAQGQTGPAGPQGPIGFPGASGAPGPQGPAGPTGPQGVQGPPGAASTVPGPTGPTGPTGPAGPAALSSAFVDTSTLSISFVSTSYVNGGLPVTSVPVGQSGIVQAIPKVTFMAEPTAASDGVCYVNTTVNGALPPDDSTAAVVYVPLPTVPATTNVPVASGGITSTYVGLTPGSRVTVAMFVRAGNLSGPFVCQTASETLTVLTY